MKLVTYETNGTAHVGALDENGAVVALSEFATMQDLIEGGPAALERAGRALAQRAQVIEAPGLLAPLRPIQMRDALTFETHLRQARANRHLFGLASERVDPATVFIPDVWYEQPVYYKQNRFSVAGTGTDVAIPKGETRFDFELELGMVLGRGGRDISRADAFDHVFGYCIFNDFSARDLQMREVAVGLGPAKGKDFDGGNVLGPWLVTADEVDVGNLTMIARINGEEWARGNSGQMHHGFDAIIEHISRDETLYAGEFFGSGTVGGGCGLELGRFLSAGDTVELEISGLGILRNRVAASRQ
ncbi:fumarylacetoacetate hydrolase family protein [Pseudosulfitobacter sp. DSM 107133]|uniref:fumarylacetoacetate hydrolase family protein n=1 Tax=Pseudosulfitobacter sp. DSM 107133 TaxID=2883100 RepID=UPI000DF3828D|nr:fumarylacetoacetate hydrolase family protein [Pseudosulfitobacter sp. DSM 107133]UOA28912.1 hypothetical protein DSM107133_03671 [Pseudosulfitobacter sp. DSM 107133]